MAERKANHAPLPRRLIYAGACLLGILILVLWGVIPAFRAMADLDVRAASLRQQIAMQKTIQPFHRILRDAAEQKDSTLLPFPAKTALPRARIDTLPIQLAAAAKASGMILVSATPNVAALAGGASLLPVNLVLKGNFIHFRKFLIHLGSFPYMEHVEEITIQSRADAKEYRLKLWAAMG